MLFFFFLMIRRPPRSTLFPSPPLSRPPGGRLAGAAGPQAPRPRRQPERVRRGGADGDGAALQAAAPADRRGPDRKSTRLNSSHANISYAVFCLKKKKKQKLITRLRHDK